MVCQNEEADGYEGAVDSDVDHLPERNVWVVTVFGCVRVGFGHIADQSQPWFARRPTGTFEKGWHLVVKALNTIEFSPNVPIVTELKNHWVKCLWCGRYHSENDALLLCLVSAEDPVPHHNQCSIILVNAVRVLAMVNSVLARSIYYVLDETKITDHFVMQPNLIDKTELDVHHKDWRWYYQRQWQWEYLKIKFIFSLKWISR